MKKLYSLLAILVALTVCNEVIGQTNYLFDLGSSFSPAWSAGSTSGTATNINGSGVNCTLSLTFNGSGSFSSPYPRVNSNNTTSGDFQVQNSTDAMEIDLNLGSKTSYVDITYTFSKAVQNVSFGISDIDRPNGGSPWTYVDQITVTGAGAAGTVTPTLTKYNSSSSIVTIAGNVATGNTGSGGGSVASLAQNNSDQDGTVFVSFGGNSVTSITIRYTTVNSSLVNNNPGLQAIAIGNVTFQKSVAPTTSNVTTTGIVNTAAQTAISGLSGSDDESIASYTIATIPAVTSGILYYNNGTTYVPVTAGLTLTTAQVASLKFDPSATYTGNATFTYTATDNRGNVSNTSTFTIPVLSNTLPITLMNFSALWNNGQVNLTWNTAQEFNTASFIVEKSDDGLNNWTPVATVAAAGNSTTMKSYSAIDAQPYAISYYRIKEIDTDGKVSYTNIVRVAGQEKSNASVKVYPNPAVSKASVSVYSNKNQQVSVQVYNANGVMMQSFSKQLGFGNNSFDIANVASFNSGMYIVNVTDGDHNKMGSVQFIKQ